MTFSRRPARECRDDGFTLIELLVVLVLIPLIIGGIAEALIVSFNSEHANSARISDTDSAQIAQDYFVRDAQSASYLTTLDNSGNSNFTSVSPKVCSPGAGTLILGLYRPAVGAAGTAFDIGYWLESTGSGISPIEIDRYACSLNSTYSYTAAPTKTVIASAPPGTALGQTLQSISAIAEIRPSQFAKAANVGWTLVAAYTTATGFSGGTLSVGSTSGFANGTITVVTTAGAQYLSHCAVASTTTFTGCETPAGTVTNGDPVTQSNVSAIQISVSEPGSSYHYSLLGAPRSIGAQNSAWTKKPTLLTLGNSGINPGNGGGSGSCPDGHRANICVGTASGNGGVVVDANGTVWCNGGGVHDYIWFQNNDGVVQTVSPSGSSNCNGVDITGDTTGVPDPVQPQLPNNGCMPASFVADLPTDPDPVNGNAVPGVYVHKVLSGTLEPGVYVVEDGMGDVAPATASPADPYFHPYAQKPYFSLTSAYDAASGSLLFVPAHDTGQYLPSQGCYTEANSSPADVALSVHGLLPLDTTQAATIFGGSNSLGAFNVWLWEDASSTTQLTIPHPGSVSTSGGLLYAPSADLSFSGNGSLATGSAVVGGVTWNGTDTLCLNWPPYSSC